MQYMGGKSKIAKQIAAVINPIIGDRDFYEPFCGACWVTQEIKAKRIFASDAHYELICMWQKLQEGWIPPTEVTEKAHREARSSRDIEPWLKAFIGFGCSFGGRYFKGFARSSRKDRVLGYAHGVSKSLRKQIIKLNKVKFAHSDYSAVLPQDSVIYCDPPYANTTGYSTSDTFCSNEFWEACRLWASWGNIVFVSEYEAPRDFKVVLEIPMTTTLRTKGVAQRRIERLFSVG